MAKITLKNILDKLVNNVTDVLNFDINLQSVTKIMGNTAIWAFLCFYPLPPLNDVEKQRAKLASSHVMGSQHSIEGKGDFYT